MIDKNLKLLILAQPKSASTSLMHALGDITQLTFGQQFHKNHKIESYLETNVFLMPFYKLSQKLKGEKYKFRNLYPAREYNLLSKFHSDICDFDENVQISCVLPYAIHKQHFPPTLNNIKIFSDVPKVLLLRDPIESITAYLRVPENQNNKNIYSKLRSDKQFKKKLIDELLMWQKKWKEALLSNNTLILDHHKLLKDPAKEINTILNLLGRKDLYIQKGYVLPKARFYR